VLALSKADVKERLNNGSMEVVGSTPTQFAAAMKADLARMSKLIKGAGIRAD
jgi:tripartite-type tricarboxylate transporter receptor subunit TctC